LGGVSSRTGARTGKRVALADASSPLSVRRLRGELMDDPALAPDEHRRALAQLARLNALAAGHRILWPAIERLARIPGHPEVRVLDIATGSGDIPMRLARRAARAGLTIHIDACDTSEVALEAARERSRRAGLEMNFIRLDAIADPLPGDYDVVMCSLFLHHLGDDEALDLLYKMRCAARRLVLVSDLVRSRVGYALAAAVPRVLTRSRVVHVDAVRSVEAAFSPEEFGLLASEAGMAGATVTRHWPQRMLLKWVRA
jgi:2-polyprenyl-3-methyl-5-hydroxy-6-metoxy-1,4-benzoquinol methylase